MATPNQIDVFAMGAEPGWPQEQDVNSGMRHAPAAATAAVVTLAADADRKNIIGQIWCSYSAAPTGGSIKIEDGATTIWGPHQIIAGGTFEFTFSPPLAGTRNTAMTITLASGAGAVEGVLSVNAWKRK